MVPHGLRGGATRSSPLPPAHSWLRGPSPGFRASQPPPPLARPASESASDSGSADAAPSSPLPPSRPSSPAPGWAQAGARCAPHPLLAQLARPRCSREEAAARAPQAPPARGPSREAGRPARPGPRWVSGSGGRRVGPLQEEAPRAGATPVNAPGPAGGLAGVPAAPLGPERARSGAHLWAPIGAARGLWWLGTPGQRAEPRTGLSLSRGQRRGAPAGRLTPGGSGHAGLALGAAADRRHALGRVEPGAAGARRPLP